MTGRTALIAGATGLVGGHLLKRLLASPDYDRVVAVTRKPLGLAHPKLREIVSDFDALENIVASSGEKADDAFCALGTTIRIAGSQEAFRRVDYDYVVGFARAAKKAGAARFLLVSAVGSSASSTIFYSRVKGEAEEAISAMHFPAFHIFRPGVLLGERKEKRPTEAVLMVLTPFLNTLMHGPAAAYRGISADTVAASMIAAAALGVPGRHVHTYRSMTMLSRR
jgi:uncharacterized protein YbjT (DUF2867 family)